MEVLVNPDIHGRTFWIEHCKDVSKYDKVIFLGDYLDSYDFERISVESAMENFKKIIEFKKKNNDKVVLLLGNHDMPYYSEDYFALSFYHCRHSVNHHDEISKIFQENKDLFQLAYAENGVLYSHAGIIEPWLRGVVGYTKNDLEGITNAVNSLLSSKEGIATLFKIGDQRGGRDRYPSCIWCDVREFADYSEDETKFYKIKQVFGHTNHLRYLLERGNVKPGYPTEIENFKMLDCGRSFILDEEDFKLKQD